MSVNSVGSANINFPKAELSKEIDKTLPEAKVEPKKDGAKKLALALGGLAAIGAVAVGIAVAVKKHKVPDNLNLEEFKKVGNFEKGKAFLNGKAYTGVIEVPNKTGKTVIEYSNGVLKSSTKMKQLQVKGSLAEGLLPDPSFREVSKKVYSEKDGAKVIEKFNKGFVNRDGKCSLDFISTGKTTITPDKVTRTQPASIGERTWVTSKQPDGSWQRTLTDNMLDISNPNGYVTVTHDLKTGELLSKTEHSFNIPQSSAAPSAQQEAAFQF